MKIASPLQTTAFSASHPQGTPVSFQGTQTPSESLAVLLPWQPEVLSVYGILAGEKVLQKYQARLNRHADRSPLLQWLLPTPKGPAISTERLWNQIFLRYPDSPNKVYGIYTSSIMGLVGAGLLTVSRMDGNKPTSVKLTEAGLKTIKHQQRQAITNA